MKKNMGLIDRIVRIVLAMVFAALEQHENKLRFCFS